jgi:hypothetical protein
MIILQVCCWHVLPGVFVNVTVINEKVFCHFTTYFVKIHIGLFIWNFQRKYSCHDFLSASGLVKHILLMAISSETQLFTFIIRYTCSLFRFKSLIRCWRWGPRKHQQIYLFEFKALVHYQTRNIYFKEQQKLTVIFLRYFSLWLLQTSKKYWFQIWLSS